jgi:hypothetical protein
VQVPAGTGEIAQFRCGHRGPARQPDRDPAWHRRLVALHLPGVCLRHDQIPGEQFDELTAAPNRRIVRWAGCGCLRTPGASRDQVSPAGIQAGQQRQALGHPRQLRRSRGQVNAAQQHLLGRVEPALPAQSVAQCR